MNLLQRTEYKYEIPIWAGLRKHDAHEFSPSRKALGHSRRRSVMRSLLIALSTLLTVSFGAWAFLVLVVLEH